VAGTAVASEQGPVPIDRLEVGDAVLALDLDVGATCVQKVSAVIRAHANETLELHFGDEVVTCTPAHRFYTGRWVAARDLAAGDRVLCGDGRWQELQDARPSTGPRPVFNLEVEGLHNYLVGRSGLVVHNVKDENGDGENGPPDEVKKKAPRRRSQRAYAPRRGGRRNA